MTRQDMEKILLDMVGNVGKVAKTFDPEIDHISMACVEGSVQVVAFKGLDRVLDGYMFAYRTMRLDGEYLKADGSPLFEEVGA